MVLNLFPGRFNLQKCLPIVCVYVNCHTWAMNVDLSNKASFSGSLRHVDKMYCSLPNLGFPWGCFDKDFAQHGFDAIPSWALFPPCSELSGSILPSCCFRLIYIWTISRFYYTALSPTQRSRPASYQRVFSCISCYRTLVQLRHFWFVWNNLCIRYDYHDDMIHSICWSHEAEYAVSDIRETYIVPFAMSAAGIDLFHRFVFIFAIVDTGVVAFFSSFLVGV